MESITPSQNTKECSENCSAKAAACRMNISHTHECGIENPQKIPLLFGGNLWGLFVLKCVGTNSLFQFVGTDFKMAGIVKGLQVP